MLFIGHIRENALKRSEIRLELRAKVEPVLEHLIKIFYHREDEGTTYFWEKEAWRYLHKVALKKNNKTPDYALIIDGIWYSRLEDFDDDHKDFIDDINEEYEDKLPRIRKLDSRVRDFCFRYFDWLAKELAKSRRLERDVVVEEIESLLKDYPL